jgi:GTP pyrophosphokinase
MDVKDLIRESFAPEEKELIKRAFAFSKSAHHGQKRKSGDPYFNHCFQTAFKLAEWQMDAKTIAAGLLHDVVEDTKTPLEKIGKEFGEEIAFLIDGVTKLGRVKYRQQNSAIASLQSVQSENIRKMILALSQDLRVVFIKLADRLHNMQTLSVLPSLKQKRIALETMEIYAPIAYRLGMANLAGEMEDLAFPYLHHQEYKWLLENIKEHYEERQKYLEKVKIDIEQALKENKITPVKIDFRAKRYSSLYKKLSRMDMNLEQIYDLVALRIVVKTVEECYAVLGIIHQLWPPMPGRIKDYIAMPKPNGYRSLHTTVFCIDNKPTEFQIRTLEMHGEAENGIAAYWAYAQSKSSENYQKGKTIFAEKKELHWINQLKEWQKEIAGSEEFLQSLKIDFLKDRIFAVTPKGEVVDLPAGSTPVDFAYMIHTDIGNQCVGVKVNGKITPLDYQLQSGDLVEILVQKSKKPSQSWLEFAKTSIAKKRIKAALRGLPSIMRGKSDIFEFKIIAEDRVGLIKDISSVISRSHINIQNLNTADVAEQSIIRARCEIDNEKVGKLALKLKKVKGVKEISFRKA